MTPAVGVAGVKASRMRMKAISLGCYLTSLPTSSRDAETQQRRTTTGRLRPRTAHLEDTILWSTCR
jgi:hypothetical protein